MNRIPAAVLAIVAIAAGSAAARAQSDEKSNGRDPSIEERVKALERKSQQTPPESKDPTITWTLKDGLRFKSSDGNFEGAIGGRIYFIYRNVFERGDAGTTRANGFDLDTARIQLDGTFYKDYFYRLEAEAGKGADFFMKDVYLGWKGLEGHAFVLGQFKEPFSQEETCSSRFNDFAERSIVNRIVPAHDIGMMWRSEFVDKVVGVELGLFNGSGRNASDTNDEKDIAARVRVTPFRSGDNDWLKNLRIGLAATYGDVDSVALGDINGADYSNLTMIDFTGIEDGVRMRLGLELSWILGPASVRAEYVTMNREVIVGADSEDFDTDAYYLQVTYLLTGEDKPLENRVVPKRNFSPKEGTWGAWELALRLANLDASDGEDAGVLAAGSNQEVREITAGVNWWMTPNVRLMLNYEVFAFDEDVPNAGHPIDDQSLFYARFQIDF